MKHTLRSSLGSALAVLAAALVAGGCGSERSSLDENTITFWNFQSEPGQKAALRKRIDAFEAANPAIKVEVSELSWNDGKTKLLAAFSSNTAPDVLELGSDWIAQFSSSGVLADLGTLGADGKRFRPEFVAPGQWSGKLYAVPWVVDTRVLFVNLDLLNRSRQDTAVVDTTWQQVAARAAAIKAAVPDAYGAGVQGEDQHRLYKKVLPFFWSNGGELLDPSGKPVVSSPQNLEALEMYISLEQSGLLETQRQLDQMFMQGKVGYWISGGWLVDRIAKDNPSLSYIVRPLPGFPGRPAVSFAGGEYLALNEAGGRKEAAMKLVNFLTSPEQEIAFCKEVPGGMTPSDLSMAGDPFLQSPTRRVFTAQLAHARMTPVHPRWLDIEEVIENEVSQALLGRKTPQQALDEAQARISGIVQGGAGEPTADTGNQ